MDIFSLVTGIAAGILIGTACCAFAAQAVIRRVRTHFLLEMKSERKADGKTEGANILEKDLRNARIIQRALLPTSPPSHDRFNIALRYYSLEAVGGDFYSFTELREGGLGVFIGDVAGHGVSAALFLSLLKATADRSCRKFGRQPREYLQRLNRDLYFNMPASYVTGIYCHFDFNPGSATFTFSRGGHPYPVLCRAGTGRARMLKCRGTILGMFENPEFSEQTLSLEQGDRIFLYTDGFPETRNERGEKIGYGAVPSVIGSSSRDTIDETLDAIMRELDRFRSGVPFNDDVVIMGIEIC